MIRPTPAIEAIPEMTPFVGPEQLMRERGVHELVRLGANEQRWNLTIEDDGKGFSFGGRFNQDQLEEAGKGPTIIKERVRLIAGQLTVESNPGQGTRLEVTVPRNGDMPHEL